MAREAPNRDNRRRQAYLAALRRIRRSGFLPLPHKTTSEIIRDRRWFGRFMATAAQRTFNDREKSALPVHGRDARKLKPSEVRRLQTEENRHSNRGPKNIRQSYTSTEWPRVVTV